MSWSVDFKLKSPKYYAWGGASSENSLTIFNEVDLDSHKKIQLLFCMSWAWCLIRKSHTFSYEKFLGYIRKLPLTITHEMGLGPHTKNILKFRVWDGIGAWYVNKFTIWGGFWGFIRKFSYHIVYEVWMGLLLQFIYEACLVLHMRLYFVAHSKFPYCYVWLGASSENSQTISYDVG